MATIEIDNAQIDELVSALFTGAAALDNGTNSDDARNAELLRDLAWKIQ